MNEQPTLQAPLADQLGPPAPDVDAVVARTWNRIEETRARRAEKRPLFALGGALVGAAVATAVAVLVIAPPEPAEVPGSSPKSAWASTLNLSESSRVELAAEAELELLSSSSDEVRLRLDEGLVRVTVDPDEKRRWTISARPEPEPDRVCPSVDVLVIGTVFTVDRRAGGAEPQVEVAVERGVVEMRRAGKVQRIRASEKHTMPLSCMAPGTSGPTGDEPTKAAQAPAPPKPVVNAPAPEKTPPGAAPEVAAPVTSVVSPPDAAADKAPPTKRVTSRTKRPRVRRPKPSVVAAAPEPAPVAPKVEPAPAPTPAAPAPKPPSVSELLARADRARAAGNRSGAKAILEDILANRAKESGASTAAYMLAKLRAQAGKHASAARTYERAVRLGLPSALREAASAAAFQAWLAAGKRESAKKAAARYLKRYPSGRWSAKAHELLGAPKL